MPDNKNKLATTSLAGKALASYDNLNNLHPWISAALGFVPVVGQAQASTDVASAVNRRDYVEAGLAAAGFLPGGKLAVKLMKAGKAVRSSEKAVVAAKNVSSLPTDDISRAARMQEQGYTRGYFRGEKQGGYGKGEYYTPDESAAADFAKRHADGVSREYALRLGKSLDFNETYSPQDLLQISAALKNRGITKQADILLHMPGDYKSGKIPGSSLYQVLETVSGGDAKGLLKEAGFDSINAGQEVVTVHNKGTIRDPRKAAFDPRKRAGAIS